MKTIVVMIFLYYLRFWAKVALFFNRPKIIGIAGSVGKTSEKHILQTILTTVSSVQITEGNSETGVPLGILGLKQENYSVFAWLRTAVFCPFKIFNLLAVDYLIVEMGTDALAWPKNMDYLLSVVKPEYVIWLNTAAAHLEQFASQTTSTNYQEVLGVGRFALAQEDGKIITKNNYKIAIVNGDDEYIKKVLSNCSAKNGQLIYYGNGSNNKLIDYKVDFPKTIFKLEIAGQPYQMTFSDQIIAKEYWQNFMAGLLIARQLGVDFDKAIIALENKWKLPKGRGRLLRAINSSWLIDSSYNASPEAFKSQLQMLKVVSNSLKLVPVVVIGDMRELGKITGQAHIDLAHQAADVSNDIYCVGEYCNKYLMPELKLLGANCQWFNNSYELGKFLKTNLPSNCLVLVKGSQNTVFLEEAVKLLLINPADSVNLCRQSAYWLRLKRRFLSIANL
jgi:UDP-N-acetylmuramoyl-tripeptide--D-alanyl-D-alanine ligase